MPGGPIRVRIAPAPLPSSATPRSRAQLADGDVLGDPVLDVLEAGVVGVEHLAGVRPGRAAPRSARPTARRAASRGRCGSSTTRRSARPSARAARARARPARGRRRASPSSSILRSVLLDDRGVVLAELLADRLHLLAQEVLALLRLGAGLDVVADPAADLQLGEPLALQLERQLEPLGDVERLEQPRLSARLRVGGVAGGVGERAGLGDRAQEGARSRPSSPRSSRISSTTARYSRSRSRICSPPVTPSSERLDVDRELARRRRRGGRRRRPRLQAGQGHGV